MIDVELNIFDINDITLQDIHNLCSWIEDIDINIYLHLNSTQICNFFYNRNTISSLFYYAKKNFSDQDIVCCCWIYNNQISWMCNPKYRNCGYTSLMLKKILNFLSFDTIIAYIDSRNIASQKVAEKCGFIKDPIRRFYSDRIMYKYIYTK